MTKEERKFIVNGIANLSTIGCKVCPIRERCENAMRCSEYWNKYLSEQYPESKDKPLTIGTLIDGLEEDNQLHWEIACKIVSLTDIIREANHMGMSIEINEVSMALIKLNNIDESIGINTKSIQDTIREVTRDRLAKGFIDSIKEGENV